MEKGYIALITVLIVMAVVITTTVSVALLAIGEGQSGLSIFKGEDALNFAEGCAEDGLLKSRADFNYNGGAIYRPEGNCSISISKISIPWTMTAASSVNLYKRTIEIKYTRNPTGIILSSWKEI